MTIRRHAHGHTRGVAGIIVLPNPATTQFPLMFADRPEYSAGAASGAG